MGYHSSILLVILVFGILFSLLSVATVYTPEPALLTEPRITQEQAIDIADNDLGKHLNDYHGIKRIVANNASGYVAFDDFKSKNMTIPLVYVNTSGQLILLNEKGVYHTIAANQKILGYCSDGLYAYCGFMPPFDFDYRGKVVYGVEVAASYDQVGEDGAPYLYIVDVVNGQIVDSTFLRSESTKGTRE